MNTGPAGAPFECRRLRPALGTYVAIECRAADQAAAERAIDAAFVAIACVEERMHPTRAGSDLAILRAAAVGHAVSLHPWTWEVLEVSQRLNELSGGVFDPCLPERSGRISDIRLRQVSLAVCTAPVAIDLGGIAKGFAVDRAIDALRASGCSAGLVNAGGDLRVYGSDAVDVWLRTRSGDRLITLNNQACAVSDVGQTERPAEHRGYYSRIVNSRVELVAANPAIVLAPTAALADALTKCVLLLSAAHRQRALGELLANLGATSL